MSQKQLELKVQAAREALSKAEARLAKALADLELYSELPEVGSSVTFKRQRVEGVLTGTVLGIDPTGTFIKVQVGTGYDAEVHTIRPAQVLTEHTVVPDVA